MHTEPIPMLLWCPMCHARHIDSGEFATKPHHSHSCQTCGLTWRPAVVDTVGVQFLPGFKNDEVPAQVETLSNMPTLCQSRADIDPRDVKKWRWEWSDLVHFDPPSRSNIGVWNDKRAVILEFISPQVQAIHMPVPISKTEDPETDLMPRWRRYPAIKLGGNCKICHVHQAMLYCKGNWLYCFAHACSEGAFVSK